MQGNYGKPSPALVIQADLFAAARSRTVLPLTSAPQEAPLLRVPSWVMIDKPATVPADKIGAAFGRLNDATMVSVSRSLALFLGLAG